MGAKFCETEAEFPPMWPFLTEWPYLTLGLIWFITYANLYSLIFIPYEKWKLKTQSIFAHMQNLRRRISVNFHESGSSRIESNRMDTRRKEGVAFKSSRINLTSSDWRSEKVWYLFIYDCAVKPAVMGAAFICLHVCWPARDAEADWGRRDNLYLQLVVFW